MAESRSKVLPVPVRRAMRKLGSDIHDARRRRRIPIDLLAERAGVSSSTVISIEKGLPTVQIGNYAAVLFSLGLIQRISDLADATQDPVGMTLEEERLPKRIRPSRKNTYNADK